MAWIKRNIFFVIIAAVGLLLTGYCGYLLYNSLAENAGVSSDYQSTSSGLEALRQKTPYPSPENIQAAKADQDRVRTFLGDFRQRFAPFPPAPVEDEKGFRTHLVDSMARFRGEATNAGVELPEDFLFSFSGLMGKLTYPPDNITPWMEQLEEIQAILDILYHAKINYLYNLQRAPVSADDSGTGCLPVSIVTNQWGVVTPYKIIFRGFSAEIAGVLEGFARSSNCFIVKAVIVGPDTSVQQPVAQPVVQPAVGTPPPQTFIPPPQGRPTRFGGRGMPGYPSIRPPSAPVVAAPVAAPPVAVAVGGPVTVLAESPLMVTVSVDVIKLKASEH
jgi:hypothetical protein